MADSKSDPQAKKAVIIAEIGEPTIFDVRQREFKIARHANTAAGESTRTGQARYHLSQGGHHHWRRGWRRRWNVRALGWIRGYLCC